MFEHTEGVTPWVCTYWKEGVPYGITLWASSSEQVLEDWCDALGGLTIEGVLLEEQDWGV